MIAEQPNYIEYCKFSERGGEGSSETEQNRDRGSLFQFRTDRRRPLLSRVPCMQSGPRCWLDVLGERQADSWFLTTR